MPSSLPDGRGTSCSCRCVASRILVAFCVPYEFEDVFAEVTGADRVDVGYREAMEFSRRVYKLALPCDRLSAVRERIAPDFSSVRLERHYDLFFPIFNNAYELYALATLPDWRRRSRLAACFVSELWVSEPAELPAGTPCGIRPCLRRGSARGGRGVTDRRDSLPLSAPRRRRASVLAVPRSPASDDRRLLHRPPVGGDPRRAARAGA